MMTDQQDLPPHMDLDLPELLQVAIEAAQAPAENILTYFNDAALVVEKKPDHSPVTEADKEAERRIRQRLANHSSSEAIDILGEEHGFDGTGARYRWVIDPIDGTRSFVRGVPLFGTLVALEDVAVQRALVGVIHLPVLKTTYSAARGLGAWCQGKPLRTSSVTRIDESMISVGDPLQFVHANCEKAYRRLGELCPCLRGYADCFGHGLVIRGAIDAMLDPDLNPWDVLATQVLVEEAGGAMLMRPSANDGKVDALFGNAELVQFLAQELSFS
ncbi:MAG: histidinol phosphate phosphatase [Nitrospirales bacterium]|nr:MAG: histidinol phosphate phosphatase [Nitrospirales bacterium]